MRCAVVALLVAGCGFRVPPDDRPIDAVVHPGPDGTFDAAGDSPTDAARDGAPDARSCPAAPAGCTEFECASSPSCYYSCGHTTKRSWTAAQGQCAAMGGCLATIDDAAENTCVTTATAPVFPDVVWFGFFQAPGSPEPAGGWGWACGSSSFLAGNWGSGEPNDQGGNEDCGAFTTGGAWIDGDCALSFRYVCELP